MRLSVRAVYAIAATLITASCVVGAFATAHEVPWRLGTPNNLWEPALWYGSSGLAVLLLLPLMRLGATLVRRGAHHPLRTALAVIALAVAVSALHIIGMAVLRDLAYAAAGLTYLFPSQEIPYELGRDLVSYGVFALVFWFAERPSEARPAPAGETPPPSEIWLRDGGVSVLVDPRDILSVASAGNYVEYALTGRRRHLIRTTLRAEETRLAPFGIARIHRTRLLNLKRIVALEWRPSGDFEVRLDTGEVVAGSRRFKATVAGIGA